MKLAKRIWKKRINYLFLLPAVAWFLIFCYVPMGGLLIVFKEYTYKGGIYGSEYAKPLFKYFTMFLDNPMLGEMVRNTVVVSALKLLFGFPAPIILAIMLNDVRSRKYKKFVQTVTYFPFFVSWIIVTTMLDQMLTPYGAGGPVYRVLQMIFGEEKMRFYLIEKQYFYPVVILTHLWKSIGWNSIIYLAAITNINPELYEAAQIDGAGRMKRLRHITLPGLSTTIGLLFILSLGSLTSAGYEQIYLLQQPSNYDYSNVLDVYIINRGLLGGDHELATVGGLLQGLISLVLIIAGNYVLKKTSEVSLW